jgi:hypothetical protein
MKVPPIGSIPPEFSRPITAEAKTSTRGEAVPDEPAGDIVTISQEAMDAAQEVAEYGYTIKALQAMGPAGAALAVLLSIGFVEKAIEALTKAFPLPYCS